MIYEIEASHQGGLEGSLAFASMNRERKSLLFACGFSSDEFCSTSCFSAIRARVKATIGFDDDGRKRQIMGFFAQRESSHGICPT